MKNEWVTKQISFKYMLGDLVLHKHNLVLKVMPFGVISENRSPTGITIPEVTLADKEEGYLMKSFPLQSIQPIYNSRGKYICYIPDQFNRYYINLQQTFEEYTAKFSPKTRSTIRRKIKKFSSNCDGKMNWKCYRTVEEIKEFYLGAREVSSKSYQEKLLNSGLPGTEQFQKAISDLAMENLVRGYLLFDKDRPVAYMYCPIEESVLIYKYLGYDPEYVRWSVGNILHWFAFEDIIGEEKFKYFDFTEGQSDLKHFYSTGSLLCGNVYLFPKSIGAWFLVRSHYVLNVFSKFLGNLFNRIGLKSKLKNLMRFNYSR